MRSDFEKCINILNKQFGKKRKLYLATTVNNVPMVEIATTYYFEGSVYFYANKTSEIIKRIKTNSNISLCSTASFHKFTGNAKCISNKKEYSDLDFENFCSIYVEDHNLVLVEIKITKAFTYNTKTGYNLNFEENKVETFHYKPYS